jgi:hypothetical protein
VRASTRLTEAAKALATRDYVRGISRLSTLPNKTASTNLVVQVLILLVAGTATPATTISTTLATFSSTTITKRKRVIRNRATAGYLRKTPATSASDRVRSRSKRVVVRAVLVDLLNSVAVLRGATRNN